ncbi:MAG: RsmB/NOP family class I SAM-dependent RNA methyltransferase [Clostridia bacterium]|nr:RsmB/NOP family class I SAM-dependent RNA methyltransferase [Clostridia bacterium]
MDLDEIICHGEGLTLPREFAERMRVMLGDQFEAFCASYRKPVHPSLRVNTLKISPDRLKEIAPFIGDTVPWQENGFYYPADGDIRPGKHPLHEAGAYYIQEASAMLPASLCPPVPGDRILDLCAAPGGKATQLVAALCGEGLLVANEIHPGRAAILSQNMERMGVRNAVVVNVAPAELSKKFPAFFDKIVVDAPCSGEGMFRKEADAVTMWSPENVSLCATRQAEILDEATKMLAQGGYLVYSTCTFAPAENEGVVLAFLSRHPEFEVIPSDQPAVVASRESGLLDGGRPEWAEGYENYPEELCQQVKHAYRVFPHHCDGEGHFAVLLRKADVEAASSANEGKKKSRKPEKQNGNKGKADPVAVAVSLFEEFCREVMGGVPDFVADTVPCLFGDKLHLIPKALCGDTNPTEALKGLRILRAGLCAGTVIGLDRGKGRFEPDHALALAGGNRAFDVDFDSACAYLRGETIPCSLRGWYTVSYCGLPLGWGKASDGVMKNHYPKGLRW